MRTGSGPAGQVPLQAGARPAPAAGGVFKSAAVEVLRRTRRLMTTGEICRLALDWGLLSCTGKTPEATMASAMYGDLKRKDRLSIFIRPQEGLFGLREWAEQGLLPFWQLDHSIAGGSAQPSFGGQAGAGFGSGLLPIAAAAAVATNTPVKQAGGSGAGFSFQQHHGPAGSKGPGRHKRAKSSRAGPRGGGSGGEEGDEEWGRGGGRSSDSEGRSDSESEEQLEPKLYSLRKGKVGRLQEAVAAANASQGGAPSSQEPSSSAAAHVAACRQQQPKQQQGQGQAPAQELSLPFLQPFELPNLRPHSADGSRSQQGPSASGASNCCVTGLMSPPLYSALLQSPLVPTAGSGGCCSSFANIFSPALALPECHSPLLPSPLLAALGATPAGLPSLLSPLVPPRPEGAAAFGPPCHSSCGSSRQRIAALKATAAAADGGVGGCGATPGSSGLSTMVPLSEAVPASMGLLDSAPSQPGLQSQHSLGLGFGAELSLRSMLPQPSIPSIVFKLPPAEPAGAGSHGGKLRHGMGGPAADGPGPAAAGVQGAGGEGDQAGGGVSSQQIAQKIREVEGKVRQVEERWGPLNLKTAQAHFLLHRACRHPQAAAEFRSAAAVALQRAHDILQQGSQLGLMDSLSEEYLALLHNVQAAGGSAGGSAGALAGGSRAVGAVPAAGR